MSTPRRAIFWISAATVLFASGPGFPQQPTDDQKSAIRAQCRSDYEAHCASVPPGGLPALQCLQKNIASLSPSCQTAVRAVEPAVPAPKAETPPVPQSPPKAESVAPAVPAKTAPPPAPAKPNDAQAAAIRSACRTDYQKNCASVPPGGSAALSCLQKNKSKLSQGCQQAVGGAGAAAAVPSEGPATGAPPGATPVPAPLPTLRPMRPREELMILRSACGGDVRTLCDGIPLGGGRIAQCLASHAASLSPACKSVLLQFRAQ
ncbi:MAG: cysteine rich repeat-containing protein [Xanthobacteraceae bacterium]|nr:cysteine rich repeat-containing protein [Xanthobacteraceae bacterium]